MRIINAKFLTSSPTLAAAADFGTSEVAFLGRSNVGKSSLINALCGVGGLAKSSSTPGKTQLINFFEVFFTADLAGEKNAAKSVPNSNLARDLAGNSARSLTQNPAPNAAQNLAQNAAQNSSQPPAKPEKIRAIFVDLPGFGYAKVSKKTHANWEKNLAEFLQKRANLRLFVHLKDARHTALASDDNLAAFVRAFLRGDQRLLTIYTKCDKIAQSQRAALLRADPAALCVSNTKKTGLEAARNAIFAGIFGGAGGEILGGAGDSGGEILGENSRENGAEFGEGADDVLV